MNFALYQHNRHQYPQCSFIEVNNRLYLYSVGIKILLQFILCICFFFSIKVIIFVRLFDYRKVFALFYLWSDKRKPTAGYFRLHRLLCFIRGVLLPIPTEAIKSEWDEKSCIEYVAAGNPVT